MHKNLKFIIISLAAIFFIGISTLALYMYQSRDVHLQKSKNFYFTSDYLLADTVPTYNLYGSGQQTFSFKLRNFEDSLRFSDIDFSYSVKAVDNNGATIDTKTGNIAGGAANELTVTITVPENLREVTITAETAPFNKKLSAKLIINASASVGNYYIEDSAGQSYAKLTICANKEFTQTIGWIDALDIDCSNPYVMNNDGSISSGVETNSIQLNKSVKKGESVSINFFKSNLNANYSKAKTEINSADTQILIGS